VSRVLRRVKQCGIVLYPREHGSANTCSSTCTLSPAGSLQSIRRDPLQDKILEVGRGLSLADTQTGRYGRLYSRQTVTCKAWRRCTTLLGILPELLLLGLLPFRVMRPKDTPVSVLC